MSVTTPSAHVSSVSSSHLDALQRLCRSGAGGPSAGLLQPIVSSGLPALDRLLPSGGLRLGSLLEWLEPEAIDGVAAAAGATSYALAVGVRLQNAVGLPPGRSLLVIDREGRFYPPAILPWLESAQPVGQGSARTRPTAKSSGKQRHQDDREQRLYVIRPGNEADEIWAIDQSLRCSGVAAVIGWPERVSSTVLRRWQLAARSSGVFGLFVRPAAARHEPTWAEVRIQVCPSPSLSSVGSDISVRSLASWSDERTCRLIRVGGRWDTTAAVAEPVVECVLDLTNGRQRLTGRRAAEQPAWRRATCRAS